MSRLFGEYPKEILSKHCRGYQVVLDGYRLKASRKKADLSKGLDKSQRNHEKAMSWQRPSWTTRRGRAALAETDCSEDRVRVHHGPIRTRKDQNLHVRGYPDRVGLCGTWSGTDDQVSLQVQPPCRGHSPSHMPSILQLAAL